MEKSREIIKNKTGYLTIEPLKPAKYPKIVILFSSPLI